MTWNPQSPIESSRNASESCRNPSESSQNPIGIPSELVGIPRSPPESLFERRPDQNVTESIGNHGIDRSAIESIGIRHIPQRLSGRPRSLPETLRSTTESPGALQNAAEHHGVPWSILECIGMHRNPRNAPECTESIGIHQHPSECIGIRRNQLESVGSHQNPSESVGIHWNPSESIRTRWDPPKSVGIRKNLSESV